MGREHVVAFRKQTANKRPIAVPPVKARGFGVARWAYVFLGLS